VKEYHVHRLESCPTGEHVDPETDKTVDCTCPAMVVKASGPPGPVDAHLMQWSRGELARLVREFDRGYFDAEGSPSRTTSMFISDWQQQLLDAVRDDPLRAVTMLLARMRFDLLSFDPDKAVLSFRLLPGHYVHMLLPTDPDKGLEVRRVGTPAGDTLWQRDELQSLHPWIEDDVRGQVRKLLEPRGWSPADKTVDPLVDDSHAEDATLAQLAQIVDAAPVQQLPPGVLPGQMTVDEGILDSAMETAAAAITDELRREGVLPDGLTVAFDKTPLSTPAPRVRKSKPKRSGAPRPAGEDGAPIL